jgi:hypothetical protein
MSSVCRTISNVRNFDRHLTWPKERYEADPCGSRKRIRNVILVATSYSYPENPIMATISELEKKFNFVNVHVSRNRYSGELRN